MGVDLMEFVFDVEDAFGLHIPDDDAATITTPRKLINYLYERVPQRADGPCLSQRAFYRLRRAFTERLGLRHPILRPWTPLPDLLPQDKPHLAWAEIGAALGCRRSCGLIGSPSLAGLVQWRLPRTLGEAARCIAALTPRAVVSPENAWSWHEVQQVVDGLLRYHFDNQDCSLDGPLW